MIGSISATLCLYFYKASASKSFKIGAPVSGSITFGKYFVDFK